MGSTCDRMVRDASTTRAISRASPLPVFFVSPLPVSSPPTPRFSDKRESRRSAVNDLATAATTSGSRPATLVAASPGGDPKSRSLPNAAASAPEKSACDRPSSESTALRLSSARTSGARSCAT